METSHEAGCRYRGFARYWTVKVGDATLQNGVWAYPGPVDPKIKDLMAFYNEKVDIYEGGELLPRPQTPWS